MAEQPTTVMVALTADDAAHLRTDHGPHQCVRCLLLAHDWLDLARATVLGSADHEHKEPTGVDNWRQLRDGVAASQLPASPAAVVFGHVALPPRVDARRLAEAMAVNGISDGDGLPLFDVAERIAADYASTSSGVGGSDD